MLSKLLSLGIVASSAIVKVPQILKITSAGSAQVCTPNPNPTPTPNPNTTPIPPTSRPHPTQPQPTRLPTPTPTPAAHLTRPGLTPANPPLSNWTRA